MSKPERENRLSRQGKARKEAMLNQLQKELVAVHHKRRQRTAIAKCAAVAAVIVIAGLAWSFLVPGSGPENHIAETDGGSSVTLRSSVASVGNLKGIDERCVVVTPDKSATFESLADDELLAILDSVGQPSVLGEINGRVHVIPQRPRVRTQANGG